MVWLRLIVSNICNFRCKHCHVFKISENNFENTVMPFEIMDYALKNYIELLNEFNNEDKLTVSIYGGETLLNRDNVFKLIKKYNNFYSGINIDWVINTNGSFVTEDDIKFFKEYDVDVHVSCDGLEEVNDRNRGKGTFKRMIKALQLIKKYNVRSQINSFVMPENIYDLEGIIDVAKGHNIKRIYLDVMYSPEEIFDINNVKKVYFNAYLYGKENNISIGGPWSNVFYRYSKGIEEKRIYKHKVPSIVVNIDGTFYFNSFPLTKELGFNIKNLKNLIKSKDYKDFIDYNNNYFDKKCNNCYLKNNCYGTAIKIYQYHTLKEEGYSGACDFMRYIINALDTNKAYEKKLVT